MRSLFYIAFAGLAGCAARAASQSAEPQAPKTVPITPFETGLVSAREAVFRAMDGFRSGLQRVEQRITQCGADEVCQMAVVAGYFGMEKCWNDRIEALSHEREKKRGTELVRFLLQENKEQLIAVRGCFDLADQAAALQGIDQVREGARLYLRVIERETDEFGRLLQCDLEACRGADDCLNELGRGIKTHDDCFDLRSATVTADPEAHGIESMEGIYWELIRVSDGCYESLSSPGSKAPVRLLPGPGQEA